MSAMFRLKLLLAIVVIGVVVLVIQGVIVSVSLLTSAPSPSSKADEVNEDIVKEFDPQSAEFHLTRGDGTPGKRVKLTDGRYKSMSVVTEEKPAYADVDSDGDLDAAMLLEHSGKDTDDSDGAWRGMYLWLWQDGQIEPVKWRAGWEWTCSSAVDGKELTLDGGPSIGAELPAMWALEFVECTDHTVEDPDGDGDNDVIRFPHFTAVEDGIPVRHFSDLTGSNTLCTLEDGKDVTIKADADPRIVPDKKSPKVSAGHSKIAVADPDRMAELFPPDDNNGYVPAKVTWPDGEGGEIQNCGWIEWAQVP
ncbi:hypothetical protein [Stackebrandtia nassauensis]|uniref:Uncharacterized protein n=1 Tax=Stackebrandtia nassauensis (strain DSM 44728 / CIP 108903 / NRRL B-16338 / NBRC 102104 / LLR-40K-21) TaxID=446470 RepID=D3Q3F4_STANL|nr:hypothetical protein [Stackebrandtia nassauensis]ADD41995.1 hypothetical protein Snas_2306 [Stackebrandtia nassauensis DSM 44728]